MNIALWVLQVLLGVFFVFRATLLLRPWPQRLQSGMRYVLEMPAGLRVFAGVAEGLAGVGLVLPPLVHVLVWLAPPAAAGAVARPSRGAASPPFPLRAARPHTTTPLSPFLPRSPPLSRAA